LRFIGLTI